MCMIHGRVVPEPIRGCKLTAIMNWELKYSVQQYFLEHNLALLLYWLECVRLGKKQMYNIIS